MAGNIFIRSKRARVLIGILRKMPERSKGSAIGYLIGHAVAAMALGTAQVELLSVNGKGGEARFASMEGVVMTERACMEQLAVMLAGRAAEEIVFGDISADAAGDRFSDLAKATQLATAMETQFGFGDLGSLCLPFGVSSALVVQGVLPSVRRRLDDAMALASSVLLEHRTLLDAVSTKLFRSGLISGADLDRLRSAAFRTVA
jgi:cell division protease FtsH